VRPKKITAAVAKKLLDPNLLRSWASYSIVKRCLIIRERYGIDVSRFTLANFYRENKVTYRKVGKSY